MQAELFLDPARRNAVGRAIVAGRGDQEQAEPPDPGNIVAARQRHVADAGS